MKRLFDLALGVAAAVVLAPVCAVIAIGIKLDSCGPILFRQARLGRGGRVFYMYKFRSMVDNAEQVGSGLFCYEDDPRVTRIGRLLRRTSLDELPQLMNILNGDMSFVGPRPPVTYEMGRYEDLDPETKRRFAVPPGLTGYAQIRGRNSLSRDEKTAHDLEYVDDFQKCGLLVDLRVLAVTCFKVWERDGSCDLPVNTAKDRAKFSLPPDAHRAGAAKDLDTSTRAS